MNYSLFLKKTFVCCAPSLRSFTLRCCALAKLWQSHVLIYFFWLDPKEVTRKNQERKDVQLFSFLRPDLAVVATVASTTKP